MILNISNSVWHLVIIWCSALQLPHARFYTYHTVYLNSPAVPIVGQQPPQAQSYSFCSFDTVFNASLSVIIKRPWSREGNWRSLECSHSNTLLDSLLTFYVLGVGLLWRIIWQTVSMAQFVCACAVVAIIGTTMNRVIRDGKGNWWRKKDSQNNT